MRKPIAFIGVEFGELSNLFIIWLSFILLKNSKIIGEINYRSLKCLKDKGNILNAVQTADVALNIKNLNGISRDETNVPETLIHPSFDPNSDAVSASVADCLNQVNWEKHSMKLSLILDRDDQHNEELADAAKYLRR